MADIRWIKTKDLKYESPLHSMFDINHVGVKVIDGDWDVPNIMVPMTESEAYRAIRDVCVLGKPYAETDEYKRITELANAGKWPWPWSPELTDGMRRWMFHSIKIRGVKVIGDSDPEGGNNQISLSITRDGKLQCVNGRHRLAACMLLGVEKIPVTIHIRHKLWQDVLDRFEAVNIWGKNKVYSRIDHIDFLFHTALWSDRRLEAMLDVLPVKKGTLLDIGALFGHTCHVMEDAGFDCTAVEIVAEYAYLMDKFRVAKEKKFRIIRNSFCNLVKPEYDVVVAFNIFHHLLKTEPSYAELVAFLKRLRCKELFFQAHSTGEGQMDSAFRNYGHAEFVAFIQESLPFVSSAKVICEENGRFIYQISYRGEKA